MKRILKIITILLMFEVVKVNAASYGMYLNSSNSTVSSGEEVSVDISLGNINGIDLGLNVCEANISFSGVDILSISGINGWNVTNGSKLIIDSANFIKSSSSIAQIKLKVNNEGNILLSNIVCSDGENEYSTSGTKINFKIKEQEKEAESVVNNDNNNLENNTVNTTTKVVNKQNDKSSLLKLLIIEGIEFEFDKNIFEYNLDVDNSVEKINLKYELEDNNAKIEKIGKDELSVGKNIIELNISNGSNTSKYVININRKDILSEVNNNEEEILKALEQDIKLLKVKVDINDSNKIVYSNVLKYLKDNNKNIMYEIYENNKIIYSFKILGKNIDDIKEFSFNIYFNTNYSNTLNKQLKGYNYKIVNFDYRGKLPKDTEIVIYGNYDKYDFLYNYNFNLDNMEFIKKVNTKNNIILKLDKTGEYIISNKKYNKYNIKIFVILLIFFMLLILSILLYKTYNKKELK